MRAATVSSFGVSPKAYMQFIVEQLNLREWLGEEHARALLIRAGYRGHAPYIGFLFFRMLMPIAMFAFAMVYMFVILKLQQPLFVKLAMAFAAAWLGMRIPTLFIRNRIARRQLSIRRAFPDALDLLLICVESGMSIEAAIKKVSQEIIGQSIPLAEELTLTTAELSYLQERRQAYDNLAMRTDLEGVKAVCTALIQAERYGTPIGTGVAGAVAGNPRHAHVRGREEGRWAAAQAHGADDPVLPAGAVRRHSRPGGDPGDGDQISA